MKNNKLPPAKALRRLIARSDGFSNCDTLTMQDTTKIDTSHAYFTWLLCTRRIYDCRGFLAARVFFMMCPYLDFFKNVKHAFDSIIVGFIEHHTFYFPKVLIKFFSFQYILSDEKDRIKIIDIFQPEVFSCQLPRPKGRSL